MVTRSLIKWCDDTFIDALGEKDNRKADKKAVISGLVEGYADAAVMLYLPVLLACYYWKHQADKK